MSSRILDHIGIAVRSLEERVPFYRDNMGLTLVGYEDVAEQKVRVAILQAGESTIELLEPTSEDSPVAKFIHKRGEGVHHLAFKVEGIETLLRQLDQAGVSLIDRCPRDGAHGKRIAFIHPEATGGVLTELCE